MNTAVNIPLSAMALCYLLLLIPLGIAWYFRIGIVQRLLVAVLRMTGQLAAVGVALIYVFRWDNTWINIGWVVAAVGFATFSAVNNSELNYRKFLAPVFIALFLSSGSILLFFNGILLSLGNIFTAQYLIIISGMLLGNALKGIIIGIADFYKAIRNSRGRYLYHLAAGAGQMEALAPFFRDGLKASLNPSIASMATMGVVFLPGMMTGQIISGSSPDTAIRYQIAIMVTIFVCITLSVTLTILFSVRQSFDKFGNLREEVFREG
ncbi:MAG: ABC transporter permease [Lewinellaceae bacterium]|nr:ABC transporter permease [Lewinellaceae bacterium]MCB9287862.1 ABC transporter permease [Lewinellaceae bacterium]